MYEKQTWEEFEAEYPNRYSKSNESETKVDLIRSPGVVSAGTPVSAARLNHMEDGIGRAIRNIDADITVTVGDGEDYPTINEALRYLSRYCPLYKSRGIIAKIKLVSGFVLQEQILVSGADLSWIEIEGTGEHNIDRSKLTTTLDGFYPAFGIVVGKSPMIRAQFSMDTSGDGANRCGMHVGRKGSLYVFGGGVKNAGARGLNVATGASAYVDNANFDNAATDGIVVSSAELYLKSSSVSGAKGTACINCFFGGIIFGNNVDAKNAVGVGLAVSSSGLVFLTASDFSGAGSYGVQSGSSAVISVNEADCQNAEFYGLRAANGGEIRAYKCKLTTGKETTPAFNTPDATGAIVWGSRDE